MLWPQRASNDGIRCLDVFEGETETCRPSAGHRRLFFGKVGIGASVTEGVGLETERDSTSCTVRAPEFIRPPRRLSSDEGWGGQAFSLREARPCVRPSYSCRSPCLSAPRHEPMHATHASASVTEAGSFKERALSRG